jgi:hypothetical protein
MRQKSQDFFSLFFSFLGPGNRKFNVAVTIDISAIFIFHEDVDAKRPAPW